MSGIEHIVLFALLFFLFYLWGIFAYKIKSDLNFWALALIPVSLFSVIVGSRFGWGADYMFYKFRLEHAFTFKEDQIGFRWLNQGIDIFGLNYVGGYIVYSFIFITCSVLLVRSYGISSKYMYAFIIPATLLFPTSIIRQGLALSFIFLGLYFYNKRNWPGIIISLCIAISIHTSTLITAVMLGAFAYLFRSPFNWKITVPIYLFVTFFFDVSKVGVLSSYIQMLSLGNQFQSYIDTSDRWFGEDAADEQFQQGNLALVTSALFHVAIIYLGYWSIYIKKNHKIVYIYNSVVFGLIFLRAVFLFEIFKRFAQPLVMLYFVVLGYALFVFLEVPYKTLRRKLDKNKLKNFLKVKRFFWPIFACIMLYLIMFWGRFIFLNPKGVFFWDQ
ncbi:MULTISPECIES: EpsG family protein [Sphingobacterium]|uniref:EpsG family protein n=1 Tax=Sphingobacterium populi TaxID=1812824 RepID=A0ABW5UAM3_9SPHI|nr:EpsG family protein [Sphingobacterium sp. CFCC 11742]